MMQRGSTCSVPMSEGMDRSGIDSSISDGSASSAVSRSARKLLRSTSKNPSVIEVSTSR